MRILKVILGLALGALVLAAATFVVLPAVVQAQSATPAPQTTPGAPGKPGRGFHSHGPDTLITAAASVTRLTTQEVMTDLQSGKSLAQIAEGKGKTADDIIKAARTQLDTQLKQAVTDGHITQAQADAELAEFDQTAPLIVSGTLPGPGFGPGRGFGHGGPPGFDRHGGPDTLITAAASVTGLTTQEVMTDLQSGKSLAQIAEGKGKTADDIIKAARTQLDTQLKQAVTDGRLTQAQADAKLAEFEQTAPQIVSGTLPGPGRGFGHDGPPGFDRHGGPDPLIGATASVTGLTTQEIVTDLQSGKSLAQIAEGKGKTADDIIQAARTQLDTRLKQAVTDGRLTQAQADTKLKQFDQTASQVVSDTTLGQRLRLRGGPFNQPAPTPPAPANTSLDGNA